MKILMTNHSLRERGGSELFVAEIAQALKHRGHDVCVFSTVGGQISERIEAAGVAFVKDPAACPFRPDIIHGQHHLETMTALCFWPDVPGIYFLHGATPWEEHPPVHPRIKRYVATAPRFGWWIARECGVPEADVAVVRNFFDPARFTIVRPSGRSTRRALVFHNTMDPHGKEFAAIREACGNAELALDAIGVSFDRTVENPGEVLPEYDFVFAGGRSAIEAMACGCAVIPITRGTIAARVGPDNYDAMAALNFCADVNDPRITVQAVLEQIRRVQLPETAAVTKRIREEATLDAAADALVAIYEAAIQSRASSTPAAPEEESAALGRYLLRIAARVKDVDDRRAGLVERTDAARARAERWKRREAELQRRLDHIEKSLAARSWWHRRLWRRLRREWERGPDEV